MEAIALRLLTKFIGIMIGLELKEQRLRIACLKRSVDHES